MTGSQDDVEVLSVSEWLTPDAGAGPLWTKATADLNVNLIAFPAGHGVAEHVNAEVDVLIVVVHGEGVLEINGVEQTLHVGQACVIRKGALRAIRSTSSQLAYLTCHKRRQGLWPSD
jgi:quercetin dioxygenase-like cupin family protein